MQPTSANEITFADVIRARFAAAQKGRDAAAAMAYADVLRRFKEQTKGPNIQVGTFPCGGVYVTGNGDFQYTTNAGGILFEAMEAEGLVYRIDQVAERAKDWWRTDPAIEWWLPADGTGRKDARRRRRLQSLAGEREPHLNFAYNLLTATYSAIEDENDRHRRAAEQSPASPLRQLLRRMLGRPPDSGPSRTPSDAHRRDLAIIREQVERAEGLFRTAAQRDAQALYGRGMLLGVVAVGIVYGGLVWLLEYLGASQSNGIAFATGAVGAVVSVLQRMTVGKLELDITAGKRMLVWLGAIRPWIGAILGAALFAFVEAGLLPVIPDDANLLAFFAALGFVAGFNERFAQDMLAHSSGAFREPLASPASGAARPGA